MFGYVRPAYPELKVREHELYRAYYCGICRALGRLTGQLSRFTLSYDVVFLAMLRCVGTGDTSGVSMRRCAVHPLKKRASVDANASIDYSAAVCAALFGAKLSDDRADERGARRLASVVATPFSKNMLRRIGRVYPMLVPTIFDDLSLLSALETDSCPEIDKAADAFGTLLGHVMSEGLEGDAARILYSVGKLTGRLVYVIDAADDLGRDQRSRSYNPILLVYGEDALENREVFDLRAQRAERTVLRRDAAEEIYVAAMRSVSELCAAVELLDFSTAPELEGIVKNICALGLPGQMRQALGLVPPTVSGQRRK